LQGCRSAILKHRSQKPHPWNAPLTTANGAKPPRGSKRARRGTGGPLATAVGREPFPFALDLHLVPQDPPWRGPPQCPRPPSRIRAVQVRPGRLRPRPRSRSVLAAPSTKLAGAQRCCAPGPVEDQHRAPHAHRSALLPLKAGRRGCASMHEGGPVQKLGRMFLI